MDRVINLAGLMTPDCSSNPILGAKVNLLGSINVFEALIENNIKFLVYASSAGVFGQKDNYYPFPETHYGAYKLAVEGVARAYFNEAGISSVGIRPYVIYGPGREVGGTAGITLACKAAKQGDSYTVNFSGKAGFVYVEDVADLVEMSIAQIPSGALTFNINGTTADVSDFINIIKVFSKIFLTMAMAAIGLSTNLKDIRNMGYKPFVVGFTSMLTVGIVSIFSIEVYIKFFI